ncbi:armadillo-type protein [Protomyces lactucae-debilis]|uniref:Nucleolar protein 9 n=1 Tax=Protomyces lactucae-debilis TaxID=2754530 RepID=A0A1Y2F1J1_PROLT|nr:armadillo-type protein [Protomyces lactucae-debilis]ORY77703.1 armadillo-type protein [Protomyces lactucae-debilis]
MPRENRQRGRRKKKTEEEVQEEAEIVAVDAEARRHDHAEGEGDEESGTFFGLLDESEQLYFKNIDDALIADEFADREETRLFVENVYKEAEGKELKLATSPLGSKVLEQILARSQPSQVKNLFKTLQGNFHTLVRQRYASHVCEMLFAITATLVSAELAKPFAAEVADVDAEPIVTMENLFLYMYHEISGDLAALGADIYASHVVRDILLIFKGTLFVAEVAQANRKRYHGQKKFLWSRPEKVLPVPASFKQSLQEALASLSSLSGPQLRIMSSQPFSVSFVQALITLEADTDSGRPILSALLGDTQSDERDDFVETILRDQAGTRLCETIIESAPPALYQRLHQLYFMERMAKFAHNPLTNFVLQRFILKCPDAETFAAIVKELTPVMQELIELNHMLVVQRLIEVSVRLDVQQATLLKETIQAIQGNSKELVPRLLAHVEPKPDTDDRAPRRHDSKSLNMQGAFLLEAFMNLSDDAHKAVTESLLALSKETLLEYAKLPAPAKLMESFLLHTRTSPISRKLLINSLFGSFPDLACDARSSRLVDVCWQATGPIKLYKDRIAHELVDAADQVRANFYGRIVWRNWHLDLFKNKRGDWQSLVKQEGAKAQAMSKLQDEAPAARLIEPQQAAAAVDGVDAGRAEMMAAEEAAAAKRQRKAEKKAKRPVDEIDDLFSKKKRTKA